MALAEPRNRYVQVAESATINGIDFVEMPSVDATTFFVHFINIHPVQSATIAAAISGGDRIRDIAVNPIDNTTDWSADAEGRPILKLTVDTPGDFSTYTLMLVNAVNLDPYYSSANFSFKILCPSDFDCVPVPAACPADTPPLPAIDYLAKDFQSFKLALTDFSSQRYPSWQERSEADFGIMFMEALCAVADELSYLQDRVAAEATLLNATERRSLVSMARLVDYEPQPALSASTTIQCNVSPGTTAVQAGLLISASAPDSSPVPFEIGTGLADNSAYTVSPLWNDPIQPYWFDDSQSCLPCGATSMYLMNPGQSSGPAQSFGFSTSVPTALLIQTDLPGQSIRELVHVLPSGPPILDSIFLTNGQPTQVTLVTWDQTEALQYAHDLTATHVAGNILPATQGQRFSESFAIDSAPVSQPTLPLAIARRGPNGTDAEPNWIFRYPLARGRLTWLPSPSAGPVQLVDPDIALPQPELTLSRTSPEPAPWQFATSLLDATSTELAFTLDPQAWRVVAADGMGNPTQWEYDGSNGDTLRFGDGTFGETPNLGDVYQVTYRVGLGAAGNVAADAINVVAASASGAILSARNPFLVTNGADEETAQHIQRMAPQAFRTIQYRAVLPSDYEAAAQALPWVLKAGTAFRWTGSWLTVFTTTDPKGNESMSISEQQSLIDLLNRRRMAGYESYAPTPDLVSIDLHIWVCVDSGWVNSEVELGILNRLANAQQAGGATGFFFADRFTFGTPLYRSRLEAAIQGVDGVAGVLDIQYRFRGASNTFLCLPEILPLSTSQILRVDNDPSYPERGTIRVYPEGGQ